MSSERFLAELISIRQKYNRVVFELEKSKEKVTSLVAANKKLAEECDKYKQKSSKVQEEKEQISSNLEEALKNLELSTREKAEQIDATQQNDTTQPLKQMDQAAESQISALKKQNNALEARIKQMELGVERNKQFQSQNEHNCVQNIEAEEKGFDIEKILNHQKKGNSYVFLVRWKGYGPSGDTWEPKSNLQCANCKIVIAYMKKNKI